MSQLKQMLELNLVSKGGTMRIERLLGFVVPEQRDAARNLLDSDPDFWLGRKYAHLSRLSPKPEPKPQPELPIELQLLRQIRDNTPALDCEPPLTAEWVHRLAQHHTLERVGVHCYALTYTGRALLAKRQWPGEVA
jgi:hypothetical protein